MAETLDISILAIYLLVLLGIGIVASKKIKHCEDFICAGKSLGFWLFTILMVGTVCSGMSLLGVSGFGYISGWPGIWEQLFVPLAVSFCVIFFGVKLQHVGKTNNYMTVQDYFAHRFQSPTAIRSLSAISGILVSLIYLAGQYTAISIVLIWLFNIPHWMALVIAAVIVTIYTTLGGLYAVAWTSLFQGLLLIIGVVIMAPLVIMTAGGMTHINEVLTGIDPNMVQPFFPSPPYAAYAFCTPEFLFSFAILLMVGLACAPHVINNVLAVKESKYFKWVPLCSFLIYLVVMLLIKFSGFAGRALVEEGTLALPAVANAQDFVFVYAVQYATQSVFLWGIFGVIVLAAVMSTTDRLMLTIGSLFGWDIYRNVLRPDAKDHQVLRISQIATVIGAVVTLFFAINPPEILAFLIWMGIGVMLSTFAIPLLAGLYWRGATRQGAIASMVCGLIASGVIGYYYQFVAKLPMHFSIYALAVSLVAMIVVSLATAKNDDTILDETLTGWYIQPR